MLKQRIITGVTAGAGFLILLYMGGYWFASLIILLAVIGFHEYVRLNRLPAGLAVWLAFAGAVWLVISSTLSAEVRSLSFGAAVWVFLFLLLSVTVISKNKVNIEGVALLFLGALYIGIGFHYMIYTRLLEHGLFWTLLVYVCIWATDSGAYFCGMAFGKRPLWPAISPKKTVEGSLGGIALAIAAALVFSLIRPELLGIGHAVLLGLVIALAGQMGDLIQSAYKRVRNVKDTGAILPGHGGVLDRCDSWLIVFPFVHFFSLIPQ